MITQQHLCTLGINLCKNQAAKKGQINKGKTLLRITRKASIKLIPGLASINGNRIGTAIAAPILAINV